MEKPNIKITLDPNGNVHREIVDRPRPEVSKPQRLKRIVSALALRTTAEENS